MIFPETLQGEFVNLRKIKESDFEALCKLASDPLIWKTHTNKKLCEREVFKGYFERALQFENCYVVILNKTGEFVGSSRLYDMDLEKSVVTIGYTWYSTKFWGTKINPNVKLVLLKEAFKYFSKVNFCVDNLNFRSQRAMMKLGATHVHTEKGTARRSDGSLKDTYVYQLTKEQWPSVKDKLIARLER